MIEPLKVLIVEDEALLAMELESLVDSVDLLAYWQSSARQFLQMNE